MRHLHPRCPTCRLTRVAATALAPTGPLGDSKVLLETGDLTRKSPRQVKGRAAALMMVASARRAIAP
jgi:hypothetical protein